MANSTDLLRWFRQDMDDLEEPPLWSDEEVFEYANDAQIEFCRQTEGIADSRTPSICQLQLVAGTEWYTVSPLITKLRAVRRSTDGREVTVINPEQLTLAGVWFDGKSGPCKALVAGLSDNALRSWPITNETILLNMEVFRLPLLDITDEDQPLEIANHHLRHLVLWMRSRAYLKQDADTYDPRSSEKYAGLFGNYCFKALQEQERARRVIGTVAYGGI